MKQGPFAHSFSAPEGESRQDSLHQWEPLFTGDGQGHLEQVAKLAAQFAKKFGAEAWGYLAGLWHDLGKYQPAFQAYLFKENGLDAHLEQLENYCGRVDHSTAGGQHAVRVLAELKQPEAGRILAYCIAGHHAGLADADAPPGTGRTGLNQRLDRPTCNYSAAPNEILSCEKLPVPPLNLPRGNTEQAAFQISLFCRMLFSCLVDADFLATEAYMSPHKTRQRPKPPQTMVALERTLDGHLNTLMSGASPGTVSDCRRHVLDECRKKAVLPPGLFSLTVPTGGGKTLSSLAFALKHANQHNLDRVIYAIPFTSIIEQTADTFRDVFNASEMGTILEHHTNLDPDQETRLSRLASQNWDAPIIVTTNVQLFDSLFASKTSKCRKLHRIARSVIILDEAQTLPVELLRPCLAAIQALVTDYGCTIVLCTATQPAIQRADDFPIGLENVHEIVPNTTDLYNKMRRVNVKSLGPLVDEQLVEQLAENDQFLCIVNTRSHASRIFEALRNIVPRSSQAGLFHLSTLMCGEHRSRTIRKIRRRLKREKQCRVVSTQLIEAGVDIDFPVVYRALTGIDSIAQAAGRCNREGRLGSGNVFVFQPSDVQLRGYLRSVADTAAELIPDANDLLDLDVIRRYFDLHYSKHRGQWKWDEKEIMSLFRSPGQQVFDFHTASQRFKMIDQTAQAVIVPWGEKGQQLIEQLSKKEPDRDLRRRLQRYTVSLFENVYNAMLGSDIELLHGGYAVLINSSIYDKHLGFRMDRAGYHEPETTII